MILMQMPYLKTYFQINFNVELGAIHFPCFAAQSYANLLPSKSRNVLPNNSAWDYNLCLACSEISSRHGNGVILPTKTATQLMLVHPFTQAEPSPELTPR